MSQRAFSALIVFVALVVVGVFAFLQGLIPPLRDLGNNILTLIAPVVFIFTTLNKWFDTIDAGVTDGSLRPGDITQLFTMSGFWVTEVACLAGILQIFGIKVLDADTQALLVNMLLIGATVLLRSFSNRSAAQSAVSLSAKQTTE